MFRLILFRPKKLIIILYHILTHNKNYVSWVLCVTTFFFVTMHSTLVCYWKNVCSFVHFNITWPTWKLPSSFCNIIFKTLTAIHCDIYISWQNQLFLFYLLYCQINLDAFPPNIYILTVHVQIHLDHFHDKSRLKCKKTGR